MIGPLEGRLINGLVGNLVGEGSGVVIPNNPNLTPPSIVADGQLGEGTTFTRTAGTWTGGTISGKWQKSTAAAPTTYADIPGATGSTYVLPGTLEAGARYRYAEVSSLNPAAFTYSNSIMLTVPVFTVNPTTSLVEDPYWSNVSLLMGFNATDTPAIFADESNYRQPVTAPGGGTNWSNSTTSPQFGTGCGYFVGGGGRPTVTGGLPAHLQFGTGDFTLEGFFKTTSQPASMYAVGNFYNDAGSWGLGCSAGKWGFFMQGQTTLENPATTANNTWVHVAVSRQGDNLRLYVNGTMVAKRTGFAAVSLIGSNPVGVGSGSYYGSGVWFLGYIDELRITKGVARYVSDTTLTVPTAAFLRAVSPLAVGTSITTTSGTATGRGNTISYQWYRGGSAVVGQTTATYTLSIADDTLAVVCRVTVTNAIGSSYYDTPAITAELNQVGQTWERVGVTQSISGYYADVRNQGVVDSNGVTQSISGTFGDASTQSFAESDNRATATLYGVSELPSTGTPYYTAISALSPVSHWKLDETSGTTAADTVGFQNGVIGGTSGVRNHGSHIDAGISLSTGTANFGWLQADNSAFDSSNFTVTAWALVNQTGLSNGVSMTMFSVARTAALTSYRWKFELNPSNGVHAIRGNAQYSLSPTFTTWASDTWYHIAVTYNGTTVTFYINGVAVGTTNSLVKATQTGPYSFMAGGDSAANNWRGKIDEVSFFSSVLTAPQILGLYNAGFQ